MKDNLIKTEMNVNNNKIRKDEYDEKEINEND